MDKALEDWNRQKLISRTVIQSSLLPASSGQRQRWHVRLSDNEKWLAALLQAQVLREKHSVSKQDQINQ